jgi:hypothetical protein
LISSILNFIQSENAEIKLLMDDLLFAPFDAKTHTRINLTSAVASTHTVASFYSQQGNEIKEALDDLLSLMEPHDRLKAFVDLLREIMQDLKFVGQRKRAPAARLRFLVELLVHLWYLLLAPGDAKNNEKYNSAFIQASLQALSEKGLPDERKNSLLHLSWCTNKAFHCQELEVLFPKDVREQQVCRCCI